MCRLSSIPFRELGSVEGQAEMVLLTTDTLYKETKDIKLGLKKLRPPFSELADWIVIQYRAAVLNITLSHLKSGKQPNLNIVVERPADSRRLCTVNDYRCDKDKQLVIVETLEELIWRESRPTQKSIQKARRLHEQKQINLDDTVVYIDVFEPVAKQEVNMQISKLDLAALQKELSMEELWTISQGVVSPVFFLYTDEQVARFDAQGIKERFAEKYLALLTKRDPFGYFDRGDFEVLLDSKENFERAYSGNWYYYYK